MNIRLKLLFLLVFTCTILASLAVFTVQGYMRSDRQVRILAAALNDLYGVTRTRSAILNQIVHSMNYRLTGRDKDRKRYEEIEAQFWRAHAQWRDAIRRSRDLGLDKDEEADRAAHVERIFKEVKKNTDDAFVLAHSGKIAEAYHLLETKVEPLTDHVLNDEVDEAVLDEVKEFDDAYNEVLMHLGSMPWGGDEGVRQAKIVGIFVQYYLVADRVISNVRKEYKELTDYLISGEEGTRQDFEVLGVDIKKALEKWFTIIKEHTKLGGDEKQETLRVLEVEKHHNEFMELAATAIEMKSAGKLDGVMALFDEKVRGLVGKKLIPKVSEAIDQATKEIDDTHHGLRNVTLAVGVRSVLLLALVSSVIAFTFIGMIRKIIVSLGELRRGTEVVGTGDLSHRIALETSDELGQLASSFNKMAGALQRSRDEMVLAKEYTHNIIRSMSDMLVVVSPEGLVQTVNDAVCSLLGYRESELIGRPVDMIFQEGPPVRSGKIGEKDEIRNVEKTYLAKNGRKIPVSFSTSVMRNDSGRIDGIVCVAQDITDRKRWEESLLLSESTFRKLSQEFHTLLDAIPYALLLLNSDLEVQWANRGAAAVFSRKNAALIGEHCHVLWYGNSSPCPDCYVRKCFRTGNEEVAHRSTPDGKFWDLRAIPIKDGAGQVQNVINIAVDVTEKITIQAEAMQAAHLASLGELAAGVAHEINNPINSIINYAQILIDELTGESSCGELAARILKDGDRISAIVGSLLSFARVFEEDKSGIHVNELLSNALALTETQLQKDGITTRVSAPGNLPEVIAHAQQIEQVFLNVISNARYALIAKNANPRTEKRLEIETALLTEGASPFIRVSFTDNGIGIAPQILDKVVEPFFSTKPRGEGTGLGLSISHGIVSDHGGKLKINSIEGIFTRITIDLPARRED